MSSFSFDHLQTLEENVELNTGFFLWIWHADKVPPHIGCSVDGVYFSLKVNGKDEGLRVKNVFKVLKSKQIPSVLVKLNVALGVNDVQACFSKYLNAGSNGISCLSPLKELLQVPDSVGQLSELLKYLQSKQVINFVFGLNLKDGYTSLPEYGKEDIANRLLKLENAKRSKNIPKVS